MPRIYLDYAAGAPMLPAVQTKLQDYLNNPPTGNPSSLHAEGRQKQAILDEVHTRVASIVGVQPTEVILTSGATEGNNLAVQGTLAAWRREHPGQTPHIVMSAIEHPSWYLMAEYEEVEITRIPVSPEGEVEGQAFIQAIRPNTALVGCAYVNNEIGIAQPVPEIGKGIEQYREEKRNRWPLFHTDAVQAFPYLNTHIGHLHADSITFSSHKYGGLEGIGCLVIRSGIPRSAALRGGNQEWGIRAGTENVLGAISMAESMLYLTERSEDMIKHAHSLQQHLEDLLTSQLPEVRILGRNAQRSPHMSYLWLPQVTNEHMMHKLDLHDIAVASGSACSSGGALPSATLLALGFNQEEAFGGIRVSYGWDSTKNEIDTFVTVLSQLLSEERSVNT